MSEKLQSTAASEESSEQPSQFQSTDQDNNPSLNIFSSFTEIFNLVIHRQKKEENQAAAVNEVKTEAERTVVRFPSAKHESFPSVKLEIEEKNTNPVVLWQVYAIGGFLILKWAWTRWNEQRTRKKPSDDQPPPAS